MSTDSMDIYEYLEDCIRLHEDLEMMADEVNLLIHDVMLAAEEIREDLASIDRRINRCLPPVGRFVRQESVKCLDFQGSAPASGEELPWEA